MSQLTPGALTRRTFIGAASLLFGLSALYGCNLRDDEPVSEDDPYDDAGTNPTLESPSDEDASQVDTAQDTTQEVRIVSGGKFRAQTLTPTAIDPFSARDLWGMRIARCLFDSLTAYDARTRTLVGKAAISWESDEDATSFTFHLREGVSFHNAEPMTASCFVRAWTRLARMQSDDIADRSVGYRLSIISGYEDVCAGSGAFSIECPDDYTLIVNLERPCPLFAYMVSLPCFAPIPQAAEDDFDAYLADPVGNGAFMMGSAWEGADVSLVKNPAYWSGESNIDAIEFMVSDDLEADFSGFSKSNYDLICIPSGNAAAAAKSYGVPTDGATAMPGEQALLGQADQILFLACNCQDEVFSLPAARRALAGCLDTDELAAAVDPDRLLAADNIIPAGNDIYQDGVWSFETDAEQCGVELRTYLAQAGKATLEILCESQTHTLLAQALAAQLSQAGIEAEPVELSEGDFYARLHQGQYQLALAATVLDYPSASSILYPLFHSRSCDNVCLYASNEIDTAIEEACATKDVSARYEALQQVNAQIAADVPLIPLVQTTRELLCSDRVNSLYVDPALGIDFFNCWLSA